MSIEDDVPPTAGGPFPNDLRAPNLYGFERLNPHMAHLLTPEAEPAHRNEFRDQYCEVMLTLALLRETQRGISESEGRPCCRLVSQAYRAPDGRRSFGPLISPRLKAWRAFKAKIGWSYKGIPFDQWIAHEILLSAHLNIPWLSDRQPRIRYDAKLPLSPYEIASLNLQFGPGIKPLGISGSPEDMLLYATRNPLNGGRHEMETWSIERTWLTGREIRGRVCSWNDHLNEQLRSIAARYLFEEERLWPADEALLALSSRSEIDFLDRFEAYNERDGEYIALTAGDASSNDLGFELSDAADKLNEALRRGKLDVRCEKNGTPVFIPCSESWQWEYYQMCWQNLGADLGNLEPKWERPGGDALTRALFDRSQILTLCSWSPRREPEAANSRNAPDALKIQAPEEPGLSPAPVGDSGEPTPAAKPQSSRSDARTARSEATPESSSGWRPPSFRHGDKSKAVGDLLSAKPDAGIADWRALARKMLAGAPDDEIERQAQSLSSRARQLRP